MATHLFTDCEAITLIVNCLVVELPATEQSIFVQRLAKLPSGIAGAYFHLLYYNRPLPNSQRRRPAQRLKPEVEEDKRIADETDYVAKDGKFYPRAMVLSLDKQGNTYGSVLAGVLVCKGSSQRLTCSWHCWEEQMSATLLKGMGRLTLPWRWQVVRKPGQPQPCLVTPGGNESMLPPDEVAYVSAVQGVCGTGDPTLSSKPYIRDSTCGAVLLRCKMGKARGRPEKEVLERGGVCGMFHYANLTARNAAMASSYLIYADAFDPLIDDGWSIVPVSGMKEEPNNTPQPETRG